MDSSQRQLDRPSSLAIEWKIKHDRVLAQLEAMRSSVEPDSAEARIATLQNQNNQLEELIQWEIEEKIALSGAQSTVSVLEKENVLLKQQTHDMQSKLENSSNEKIALEKDLSEKQEDIDFLFAKIKKDQEEKNFLKSEVKSLKEQNSRLTDQASTLEEECSKHQEECRKELKERETYNEVDTKLSEEKEIAEVQLQSMTDLQRKYEEQDEQFMEEINSCKNMMQKNQLKLDNHDEIMNKYEERIDNYEKLINTLSRSYHKLIRIY